MFGPYVQMGPIKKRAYKIAFDNVSLYFHTAISSNFDALKYVFINSDLILRKLCGQFALPLTTLFFQWIFHAYPDYLAPTCFPAIYRIISIWIVLGDLDDVLTRRPSIYHPSHLPADIASFAGFAPRSPQPSPPTSCLPILKCYHNDHIPARWIYLPCMHLFFLKIISLL